KSFASALQGSVSATLSYEDNGLLLSGGDSSADLMAGSATASLRLPKGVSNQLNMDAQVTINDGKVYPTMEISQFDVAATSQSATFDATDFLPPLSDITVDKTDATRPILSWSFESTPASVDAFLLDLVWSDNANDPSSKIGVWSVLVP